MKLKQLAIATLAVAAAPAFAAIQLPSTGDGELFLTVYNDTVKKSFTLDLGVFSIAFKGAANNNEAGFAQNWLVTGVPEWNTFVAEAGAATDWRWTVLGADGAGGSLPNNRFVLSTVTLGQGITATSGASVGATNNAQLQNSYLGFDTYLAAINNDQGNAPFNDIARNGGFSNTGPANYAVQPGFVGNRGNGNWTWSADNAVGASSSFVSVTRSGTSNLASTRVIVDQFDNSRNMGSFTFGADAQGAYVLNYTLAPVPEPGTYALLLAGLAAVGFVARRRQAH